MPRKPLTIIGISPGTRYMGIAVFYGPELRDWGVKNMEGKWSKEKMGKAMKIVSSLIERYQPGVLAIKELHPSRSSRNLNRLVSRMKELAKRERLRVYRYSIEELEGFFYPEGRISKRELSEIIASKYPMLAHELDREKTHRTPTTSGCSRLWLWAQCAFTS